MLRLFALLAVLLVTATPARGELTHAAELASIYDDILAGRFDVAGTRLAAACPPAPAEACQALRVVGLWWRIALDPLTRDLDAQMERDAEAAIEAARAWTRREPDRAESWFYHAAAHAPLVQWRLLRGQRLTAVREASRAKASLERALDLDPALHDAQFGIGLYRYYAGIAPTAFRMLRWLLWLPGGDREDGLRRMEEARSRGQLLLGEADYQLHFVYLWYEQQHERARDLLAGLAARYPTNPVFLEGLANVHRDYFDDLTSSADAWRTLVERAARGETAVPERAERIGRMGLAETLDAMFETDLAIDHLQVVVSGTNAAPETIARAWLQLAAANDRLGRRTEAIAAWRSAHRLAPADAAGGTIRELAQEGLRDAPDPVATEAFRLSLDGLRLLQRGAIDPAIAALERSLSLVSDDEVARYRLASAFRAAARMGEAADALDRVIAADTATPIIVRAQAFVDRAAIFEADGDRNRAIALYRRARDLRGGAPPAVAAARAALERLAP